MDLQHRTADIRRDTTETVEPPPVLKPGDAAPSPELLVLRHKIDALDGELLALLNRRMQLAIEVGELKKREGAVVAFRDVSQRRLLEEELRWQASHDALTKLHNRRHFEYMLEQEIFRLRRSMVFMIMQCRDGFVRMPGGVHVGHTRVDDLHAGAQQVVDHAVDVAGAALDARFKLGLGAGDRGLALRFRRASRGSRAFADESLGVEEATFGMDFSGVGADAASAAAPGVSGFILSMVPATLMDAFVKGDMLQVLPVAVPFLCIQPLVENAVRHGLEASADKEDGVGRLSITARDLDQECVIEVEDDGTAAVELAVGADGTAVMIGPMPGLVTAIHVAAGDKVEAGQPLAVVEAMKMENILRAEKAGVVKSIHATAGESLAVDAVILEME